MKTPEPPEASPIQTFSSREVYRNPWMTVQADIIRRQDGSEGLYGVVARFLELMRGGHIQDTSTRAAYALLQVQGLGPFSPRPEHVEGSSPC